MKTKKIILSIIIIGVVTAVLLYVIKKPKEVFVFDTEIAYTGSIVHSISTTGTVQALKTVEVGTQVSGTISKLYVDYNSVVKKGQILAELDKIVLLTALETAQVSLDDSRTEVEYQTSNFNRIKALYEKELVSKAEFETAENTLRRSQATLKNAQSNYEKAKINLSYATIYSPIDGIVLNRAVAEGQTVAASFSTPTLFSIVNNLEQMQVEANVDEADIGMVREGQGVSFFVDAYPELEFAGVVTQIRFEPIVSSNVVTYTVIIKAENPELKLMPGMTANIDIKAEYADSAIIIPYKALRFKPNKEDIAEYKQMQKSTKNSKEDKQPKESDTTMVQDQKYNRKKERNAQLQVWVMHGEHIMPKEISIGINNGIDVEVISGLHSGDKVLLAMNKVKAKEAEKLQQTNNPFMPKRVGGRGRR